MRLEFFLSLILLFTAINASGAIYSRAGLSFTYDDALYQVDTRSLDHSVMLTQGWQALRSIFGLSNTMIHVVVFPNDRRTGGELTKEWMSGEFGVPAMRSQVPIYIKGQYDALATDYDVSFDSHTLVAWSEPGANYIVISSTIPGWWQTDTLSGRAEVLVIANSIGFSK